MSELPVVLVLVVLVAVAVVAAWVRRVHRTDAVVTAVSDGAIPLTHPDPLLAMLAAWSRDVEMTPPRAPALPRNRAW